ncbi:MAG: Ig-like domain-containing protein [Treponema sp.]|jgi:hypothetical protein|nr:Ig-like domain-containing protein [Treponema sp.]
MKTKFKLILSSFVLFVCLNILSCDILRFDLFEVSSWSPGNGYHSEPENILVSLNFTNEPSRASIERNFSLTADGSQVRGTFLWNNSKTMTFVPLTPLEPNIDYIINLSADAHNTKGLSMDEAFNSDFTTRPGKERPVLLSCYPQMYDEIDDPRTEVRLLFSAPVPLSTLYNSISFNPSMSGFWQLDEEDTLAIFTPSEPWQTRTRYEIRLSTSFIGINGMNIGNDFLSVFMIGTDSEAPYLLSAHRITKENDVFEIYQEEENVNWEKEDKLLLVFSENVDWITVKNNLSAEDAPSLILESETGNEFIFRFDTIPSFGSRFTIRLKPGVKDTTGNESKDEYVFKVFANGYYSKPPELAGFRMPMAPGNTDLQLFSAGVESIFPIIPISDDYYPSGENITTWIELYFDTVADINLFSIMELFRVDTSNLVIRFSPRQIKTANFSVTEPQAGWEEYQRIEIAGVLTNTTNFGIIYFQIGSGLSDSLGNKNEKPQTVSLIK